MLDDCVVGTFCKGETEGDKKTKRMGRGEMLFTQRQLNWRGLNSPCCFFAIWGGGMACLCGGCIEGACVSFLFKGLGQGTWYACSVYCMVTFGGSREEIQRFLLFLTVPFLFMALR